MPTIKQLIISLLATWICLLSFHTLQAQWKDISLNSSDYLTCVHFLDAYHGFAGSTSGIVYRTTDAGESWDETLLSANTYMIQIDFVNKSVGYICTDEPMLFKTRDGGKTWETIALPRTLQAIDFATEDLGFAVGRDRPYAYLMRTVDGGQNWIEYVDSGVSVNTPYGYSANFSGYTSVAFTEELGVVVGGFHYTYSYSTGSEYDKMIWCFDVELELQNVCLSTQESTSDQFSTISQLVKINSASVLSLQNQKMSGSNYSFHPVRKKSTAEGPFIETNLFFWQWKYAHALEAASEMQFYLANYSYDSQEPEVWFTEDAGETWVQQPFPGSETVKAIDFPHPELGYFVGEDGMIYRYGDPQQAIENPIYRMFPNPCSDILNIDFVVPSRSGEVYIYDATGRKILSERFGEQNVLQLNTSLLPAGIYAVTLELTDGSLQTRKLLKY